MKEKSSGLDLLRILSMVCVVLLHSVSNGLRFDYATPKWQIINIASSLATCAVPVFFMISGALILQSNNTYSVKYTLKNRIPRLIIPLFVWSVIYIIIAAEMDFYNRDIPVEAENIRKTIYSFFSEESAVHFWFMYYLIPLYLIAPFIKAAVDNSTETVIKYVIALWGIVVVLNTFSIFATNEYKPLFDIAFIKNIGYTGGYGWYFLLGWYLNKKDFKINKYLLIVFIAAIALVIAKATSHYTKWSGGYNEWFKSYNSITVAALSTAVFILLKDINLNKGKSILKWLCSISYGVYLCHNIFLYLVTELHLGRLSATEMLRNFICVLTLSVVLITILSKITIVRYVFTGVSKK